MVLCSLYSTMLTYSEKGITFWHTQYSYDSGTYVDGISALNAIGSRLRDQEKTRVRPGTLFSSARSALLFQML